MIFFLHYQLTESNFQPVYDSKQAAQTQVPVPAFQDKDNMYWQRWNKALIPLIIVLILLTVLPVATLIVGHLHKNDCPIQTWIPKWMIGFGAAGLATFGVVIFIVGHLFLIID